MSSANSPSKAIWRVLLFATTAGVVLPWLAACEGGMGATRDNKYQNARVVSKIIVPSDIKFTRDPELELLPLPDFTGEELSDVGTKIAAPVAMLAPEVLNQITVQSLGDKSWLISPENPSAVWPKLSSFLGRHQIRTRRTEPVIGVLESSWFTVSKTALASEQGRLRQVLAAAALEASGDVAAAPDDTAATADNAEGVTDALPAPEIAPQEEGPGDISLYRVVFKVEQAVKQGFSEVHTSIYRTSLPDDGDLPDDSKATPVAAAQRVAFLKILASDLLQASSSTSVSLLADSINTEPKAELLSEDGRPTLLVHLDQSRFYAMVKKSLTNAEISFESTEENDEAPNHYNIELDRGLLTKSQVKLPKGLKGRIHALELRVHWEAGTGRISVQGRGAAPLPPSYAEQVLTLIREFSV